MQTTLRLRRMRVYHRLGGEIEGLTVVLGVNLTLFRQALPLRSHNPSASSWREYLALYHRQLLRWPRSPLRNTLWK